MRPSDPASFDTWFGRIANFLSFASFEWGKWIPTAAGAGVLAAIGRMLESATPVEVAIAFVVVAASVLVALLALHAWRSIGRPYPPGVTPQAPVTYGGGNASPVMTAGEKSNLHYTYNDNRTQIFVLADLDKKNQPVDAVATLKLDTRRFALLDASNVASITDVSSGHLLVTFAKALDPAKVRGHSLSASTTIAQITASSADIRYDEGKPGIVEVKFQTTSGSG
jgi:hypothetical protein